MTAPLARLYKVELEVDGELCTLRVFPDATVTVPEVAVAVCPREK